MEDQRVDPRVRHRRSYQGWQGLLTGLLVTLLLIVPWLIGAGTIVSWTIAGATR